MNATMYCMQRKQTTLHSDHEGGSDAKSLYMLHEIVRFIGRDKRMRGSLFCVNYLQIRALSLLVRRKRYPLSFEYRRNGSQSTVLLGNPVKFASTCSTK